MISIDTTKSTYWDLLSFKNVTIMFDQRGICELYREALYVL